MIVLLYGKNGWISSLMEDVLNKNNVKYYISDVRANNYYDVCSEIEFYRPTHLMSFIGRTHGEGITTIVYLEDKTKLNINVRDNLYAPMVLAEAAKKYDIHLSYLGTGCIFTYDEIHEFGNENTGFTEDDIPNFTGSAYSTVKGYTDQLMQFNPNVLTLRIRMPISSVSNSRNFINKITKYKKICSIPNSMTVLDDFLPIILDMAKNNITGISLTVVVDCFSLNSCTEKSQNTKTFCNFFVLEMLFPASSTLGYRIMPMAPPFQNKIFFW